MPVFSEYLGPVGAALSPPTWVLLITFLILLSWYSVAPFGTFKRLGIPGPRPVPFFGTFLHYRKGFFNFDQECYKKYGKVWGIFDGRRPLLCIMDPDLIKSIFIKEFYTLFTNRQNCQGGQNITSASIAMLTRILGLNGPFKESVLIIHDERWKTVRSILSPTFSSGKLKEMHSIICHYANNLVKLAEKKMKMNEVVQLKEFFGAYSLDVVSSTSFSVDVDSINNPNDPFLKNIKKISDFSFFNPVILLIVLFPPLIPVLEKLDISIFPKGVNDFFMRVILNMKEKRQKGVHSDRVDFLQLLVDSQATGTNSEQQNDADNSTHKTLTDSEILAQCITFVFAGYETTSNTLSFLGYNLAIHPDVQKKLQQEIDEAFPNQAPPTYDGVMHLEYLEMVISETLRLYPPAPRLDRVCKKDVKLNGVTILKDTVVVVPAYALHRDPKYWKEPEEFRPERFSKEESMSRNPCTFLPFGIGPRNCIGMRFAQLMMKVIMVLLLQRVTLVPCDETPIPLEIEVKGPMRPKKPIILKFVPRVDIDSKE